ncbi:hypothetical protein ACKWTF_000340 [Chironomus riparius]
MENSDLKIKTKSVSQLVKSLDDQRSKSTSITSLFSENTTVLRKKLVVLIESILLEDFENIGRKTRDILWRKVYYDPISTSKKLWKKREIDLCHSEVLCLSNFIREGINHYKTLILKFEDTFNLDIRYIIDFSIIANGANAFEKKSEKEIYTVNETNHALETIHSFLICLGDLHRYCIEFKFGEKDVFASFDKQQAANYYNEAFKFNPKNGMPHNQLGTLLAGENYELNSIFHYLYSLCSTNPVELSEANVSRVFQQNNEALENAVPSSDGFNMKDFIMQVTLLIDILFYDKDISDFNAICCSVLMSFKDYLLKCRRNSQADATFQLTSIFMLCLFKLKMKNSQKVHSLNAFLVAFCAKIVETVIEGIDEYIADHKAENLVFCEAYNRQFHEFDRRIKRVRDNFRGKLPSKNPKDSGIEKNGSGNSQKDGSGSNHLSQLTSSEASQPGQVKIVKRPSIQDSHNNNNHANIHNRRRRKRRGTSETSTDESETESLISDDEDSNSDLESMNSNFDSYDEYDDIRFSSEQDDYDDLSDKEFNDDMQHESDGEDIIIENEEIVYKNTQDMGQLKFDVIEHHNGASDDIVIEDEKIVFRDEDNQIETEVLKLLKMKYKKKYTKVDPNLILKFNEEHVGWMQSLKILFDWLHLNNDIMLGCYRSNPEFVNQKIMKLINVLNIDIFTRKIFFDRSMLKYKNVRENLRHLFDTRHTIATSEDIIFKKFPLFEELQQPIDWNLNYKLQLTAEEDIVLRNFKIVDFGFHLCKVKKFNYSFCARSRVFIERKKKSRRKERNRKYKDDRKERRGRKRQDRRNRNRDRGDRKQRNSECDRFERLSIKTHSQNSNSQDVEEYPSLEKSHQINRKGYLRNKVVESEELKKSEQDKAEMMGKLGKLWLKNEVQTLESRSKPVNTNLTPYLMLDTKSLSEYLYVVKNLVKTKKFVVLIPKAVLQDLDGIKKTKEGARNAIKWLESEFQKGNRFMRTQRESEFLQMPLLKVPSKLERDDAVFMNIVPFVNFIVSNHSADSGSDLPVLTLLTGDNLDSDRKKYNDTPSCINRAGILQSIPVKYDQIVRFYSKYKK